SSSRNRPWAGAGRRDSREGLTARCSHGGNRRRPVFGARPSSRWHRVEKPRMTFKRSLPTPPGESGQGTTGPNTSGETCAEFVRSCPACPVLSALPVVPELELHSEILAAKQRDRALQIV